MTVQQSDTNRFPAEGQEPDMACPGVRHGLLLLGWVNVALGAIGLFVPLMPTTIFLLIALWAFSRSSIRFHNWLYNHPRLGRSVRDWHAHRVIPVRAKLAAVSMMSISLLIVVIFVAESWVLPVSLALGLGTIAAWIVTRPSAVPEETA